MGGPEPARYPARSLGAALLGMTVTAHFGQTIGVRLYKPNRIAAPHAVTMKPASAWL